MPRDNVEIPRDDLGTLFKAAVGLTVAGIGFLGGTHLVSVESAGISVRTRG